MNGVDFAELGRALGRAMASRQPESPAVYVNVPAVEVAVDPVPLAEAIQAGHQSNAKALEGLGQLLTDALCRSVGEAVALIPEADLAGVEQQIATLAKVLESKTNDDLVAAIADLKSAFTENTSAVADLVKAITEQNRILMKSKTVSYDAQGRITSVVVS